MFKKYVLFLLMPASIQAAQLSQQQFDDMKVLSSRVQLDAFLVQHHLRLQDIINVENPADRGQTLVSYVLLIGASFTFYNERGAEGLRLFAYLMTQGADLNRQPVQNYLTLARYFTVVARSANPVETAERIISLEARLQDRRVTQLEHWGFNIEDHLDGFAQRPGGRDEPAGKQKKFSWQNIGVVASITAAAYFFITRESKKNEDKIVALCDKKDKNA
jgi:hypothetical protein